MTTCLILLLKGKYNLPMKQTTPIWHFINRRSLCKYSNAKSVGTFYNVIATQIVLKIGEIDLLTFCVAEKVNFKKSNLNFKTKPASRMPQIRANLLSGA